MRQPQPGAAGAAPARPSSADPPTLDLQPGDGAGTARPSLAARLAGPLMRALVRPRLARLHQPAVARAHFLASARRFARDPAFALYLPDRLGAGRMPALWASVNGREAAGVILYLHGGAYIMGSPRTHRALAARLGAAAGMRALVPHYRRGPEHPFPAALEDAVTAWRALLERGYPPDRLVLAGDSAGGGLALSLLAEIQAQGLPAPAGLVAFSPFTDLTLSGASWHENRDRDAMLPASRGADVVEMWLQGADAADPRASPLFADWAVPPPPVLLFAARTELLRDDARRMADRLGAAGGRAELRLAGDLPHVWPWLCPWLPEGCATIAEAGAFLRRCVQPCTSSVEAISR